MSKSKVAHFVSEATGETYSIYGHPLSDEERERRGQLTLVACTPEEDRTRQEDAIGRSPEDLLKRYGPVFAAGRGGVFDETVDLQRLYELRDELQSSYRGLPAAVRQRYSSFEAVVQAFAAGQLSAADLKPVESKPVTVSAPAVSEAKP